MKYFIILILIFSSCNSEPKKKSDNDFEKREVTLGNYQNDSISQMNYLADLHLALNEPNLIDLEHESYRLTLQKSSGNSMIYRIIRKGDDYHKLVVKEFESDMTEGNPRKTSLIKETSFDLSRQEYKEFKNLINQSYFWTLKYWDERIGMDGDTYILEGFDPFTRYQSERSFHVVARWAPYEGSFKKTGEKLIELYNKKQ